MYRALTFCLSLLAASAGAADFSLSSDSLLPGGPLPANQYWNQFGCTGANESPDLHWENPPPGTKSFAISFYDQDVPTGSGFWHWMVYDIPAGVHRIGAGDASRRQLPEGSKEGNTDLNQPGWFGSCPPPKRQHRYTYTVYALKTERLEAPANATPALLGFFLWQNTLAKATLTVLAGPRP